MGDLIRSVLHPGFLIRGIDGRGAGVLWNAEDGVRVEHLFGIDDGAVVPAELFLLLLAPKHVLLLPVRFLLLPAPCLLELERLEPPMFLPLLVLAALFQVLRPRAIRTF